MSLDDELPFLLEDDAVSPEQTAWRILIVDDEPEVHSVTRLALKGLRFRDRGLEFLNAHSGEEARRMLGEHSDIALILLDVVMETDDAGLRVARHVREALGNDRVRIVLRTGQPGQAPERHVVIEYDINDYKEKTELTAQKLVTTVISSLRAFQAIDEVARLNAELEQKVAQRTAELELSHAQLKRSLEALEQGEQAARRLQFKLLPAPELKLGRYRFSHRLQPSEIVSGDFVDYLPIGGERVLFYLADVAGHGVASALVTIYLKRFLGSLLEARSALLDDPAALLSQLNQELLRERMAKHIALFIGVLDLERDRLLCANAGAFPYPLLADGAGARSLELPSTPVGLLAQPDYQNAEFALDGGGSLLLASDGVLEALPGADSEPKRERLEAALAAAPIDAGSLARALGFEPPGQLPDDLTLLLIRWDARG